MISQTVLKTLPESARLHVPAATHGAGQGGSGITRHACTLGIKEGGEGRVLLQPLCITSNSAHSPAALEPPIQKRTTPPTLEWGQQCSLPQANSDQLYLNVTPIPVCRYKANINSSWLGRKNVIASPADTI